MPTHQWTCPRCKRSLGDLTANGDLRINRQVRSVEYNEASATVNCRCGGGRLFFDGRIISRSGRVIGKR